MEPVLEICNISKNYGSVAAVRDLSVKVNRGEVFGLLGPNGSGKTTTLSIILGTVLQSSGYFRWFNGEHNRLVNKNIGALLEMPNFYPYLSVIKNLVIAAQVKGLNSKSTDEFDRVLEITKLSEVRNFQFRTLSYGMKQRLALASLLLGDPEILILDEPTNGLDPEGIAEVRDLIIKEAAKDKTIILASHILDEVEKVCTHAGILKRGSLIIQGKVKDLIKAEDNIIVACENIDELYNQLVRSGLYKTIDRKNNEIILTLLEKYIPKDVNEYAFKNGFILSKFEVRHKTLESQFLEIIK